MPPADGLRRPLTVVGGLALAACLLTSILWEGQLPVSRWCVAAIEPRLDDPAELVFHFSSLPRLAVALMAGAGLALAGTLFQQVLRNPLASPTTLGIEAGAQLALTIAVVAAPTWLTSTSELVTLAGATLAMLAVFACASANGFSSISLILAGLVAGLFCGALTVALRLLNQDFVAVLFIWGAGSLAQQDWSVAAFLAPRLALLMPLAAAAARPLAILSLDDDSARSVGLPLAWTRASGIALAVLLTSTITAAVGVIGFLGLAAPQIARFAGARRFGTRLTVAPLIGATLMAAVDALVGLLEAAGVPSLPTGAATALIGAPLLIGLLPRLRLAEPPMPASNGPSRRVANAAGLAVIAVALVVALIVSLLVGRAGGPTFGSGWTVASPDSFGLVAAWRVPRTAVALLAGAMLAAAGVLLQRMTGNPLAAPEVLGIGTGVAVGLIVAMLATPAPSAGLQTLAGSLGAFAAMAVILAVGQRSRFAPEQILLTGIALSALLDAFVVAFLALGDQRAGLLLSWIAGSTYRADWNGVVRTAAFAVMLLPAVILIRRWLDILPLGDAASRSLGLPLAGVRAAIMAVAALLTASAIMVAGPLTFVGLMGPHLARTLGFRRAAPQIIAACLIGALVMVVADGLGRTIIAPRQIPAGLMAALIGLPYMFWQLARRRT